MEHINYKNRTIDLSEKVLIYRNLNKSGGVWYSIKQNKKVVAHTQLLYLNDVRFIVNEKSRLLVIKNKRKFPHAYLSGYLIDTINGYHLDKKVKYNPYYNTSFIDGNNMELDHEDYVICFNLGCFTLKK